MPLFFGAYTVAFAGYLLAVGSLQNRPVRSILGWGLAFRAVLLLGEPSLSDDVFRYVWDGVVQLAGVNPYRFAPADEALSWIGRPDLLARVNHAELPTIYPPFAQLFFRVCAAVFPDPLSVRVGVCVWDCVTLLFLAGLARSYDIHPAATLVFFWNPLVLIEGAGHGHIDLAAVALVVVALLYIRMHGYGRAGVALGLAASTKLLPILVLPAFWRWAGQAEADDRPFPIAMVATRAIFVPVGFLAVFVGGYALFADVGWRVLGSLGTYAEHWAFNAPAYGLLRGMGLSGATARIVLGVVLAAVVFASTVVRVPPIRASYTIVGAFLLLTPTLHPWYVVWIVPFLCFYGHRGWLALSGLVVLAYHVLTGYAADGVWAEVEWVRWVIFGGAGAVWLAPYAAARIRTRKKGATPG